MHVHRAEVGCIYKVLHAESVYVAPLARRACDVCVELLMCVSKCKHRSGEGECGSIYKVVDRASCACAMMVMCVLRC